MASDETVALGDPEQEFGRLAVELKYLTEQELDRCRSFQSSSRIRKHLGSIMKILGFITTEELHEIMAVWKRAQFEATVGPESRKRERTFGYLCLKSGFLAEEQVFECVREQARCERLGLYFKLGEICVNRGYLKAEQVLQVLELQHKMIFACPGCGTKYNVLNYQSGKQFACQRCGEKLVVPATLDSVAVDGNLDATTDAIEASGIDAH